MFGGITRIPNVNDIRCSVGTKFVGKSENGFAEWQEEIVWDDVSLMQTKLIIELCCRTPPHIYRGGGYRETILLRGNNSTTPTSSQQSEVPTENTAHFGVRTSNDSTSLTDNSNENETKQSIEKSGVWGNVKTFISKRSVRGTETQKELEEANSAARVAKYLVGHSKLQSLPESRSRDSGEEKSIANDKLDKDTSNLQIERQSKVQDIRIGYITLPLRRLLLAWKKDKESVSVEKWFEVQRCIPVGHSDDENVSNRAPSLLMEISISSSSSNESNKSKTESVQLDTPSNKKVDSMKDAALSKEVENAANRSDNDSLELGSIHKRMETSAAKEKLSSSETYLNPGKFFFYT